MDLPASSSFRGHSSICIQYQSKQDGTGTVMYCHQGAHWESEKRPTAVYHAGGKPMGARMQADVVMPLV